MPRASGTKLGACRAGSGYARMVVTGVMIALIVQGSSARAFEWQTAAPESQGLDAAALAAMSTDLQGRGTKALLVIRHDRIVHEWYAPGMSRTTKHYTASLAKAIVGGTSLMLAIDDGLLSPDDLACKYVSSWRDDPVKSKITIRHLATHTSGIEDAEADGKPHDQLPGWKGEFWKQEPNPFLTARDLAPVLSAPGTQSAYSNPGMAMLSYCVAAALREAPQSDVRALLTERLMDPIGVPRGEWGMGYGRSFELDGLTLCANWGGGGYSPNAVARIGRFMLRRGDWDGVRLVSPETVDLVAADAGVPPGGQPGSGRRSGLCWWVNADGAVAGVPRDAFFGSGAGNQLLAVIPSLDLIVVRNGAQVSPEGHWEGVENRLLGPLMAALAP